jgi:uncharacterized protein YdeI (YjbR/CyaY-like superfamily)
MSKFLAPGRQLPEASSDEHSTAKRSAALDWRGRPTTNREPSILYRIGAVKTLEARARKIARFVAMLARGETIHG